MKTRYVVLLILFTTAMIKQPTIKLGIENIPHELIQDLKTKKVGLITNQTGVGQNGKRTVDILLEHQVPVSLLFAPEHGLNGLLPAAATVNDALDGRTIPVISLYKNGTGKEIADQHLADVDTILFDMQDSGMRHYTYISTLYQALQAAARTDKPIIVFDRPNPLASVMEGPLVEPYLKSFISIAPIPLRHGMTIGELARYFNLFELSKPAQLQVIPMKHYDRTKPFFFTGLSPNITAKKSCFGYSFLGLLGEIRPFDVGVSTPHSFTCITLPSDSLSDEDWQQVAMLLLQEGITTAPFERKKADVRFKGLQLHVTDIDQLKAFTTLVRLIQFFDAKKVALNFSPAFDKAIGTARIREILCSGESTGAIKREINDQLHSFYKKAQSVFLYRPFPRIVLWE